MVDPHDKMSLTRYGVVFGAGGGIGRETAFTFAESGSQMVVFADRDGASAQAAATESKKHATNPKYVALPMSVDITDREKVRECIDAVVRECGRIDFCCNCAGIAGRKSYPQAEVPTDIYDEVLDINARGTFFVTSEASKRMLEQDEVFVTGRNGSRSVGRGAIVNLASAAGIWPLPNGSPYNASKHACIGITQSATCDYANKGIRVNCVCPSWTDTPLMQELFRRKPSWEATVNGLAPVGRMAKTEEVGEVIHFLCGNSSSYMNGNAIAIDAGFTWTKGLA